MKRCSRLVVLLVVYSMATAWIVRAAPPQSADELVWGSASAGYRPPKITTGIDIDPLSELVSICDFLAAWQVLDEQDPEFGGMAEDEYRTGSERIVQTDNTQESIYVWSCYAALTGIDDYRNNIDAAWVYCRRFPAWEEESAYYRVWNCGWGLCAAGMYAAVFDTSEADDYAVQCAEYIGAHWRDLSFSASPPGVGIRNALTVAWAAWNLNRYADRKGDTTAGTEARAAAETVRTWLEADPMNVTKTSWALSGGIAAACVMDILFADDPAAAVTWSDAYLDNLVLYHNPDDFNPGAWVNAWDSWQALAQNALWRTTGDFSHRVTALEQSAFIRHLDGDGDGGIPARRNAPDTEDETWVSTYIVLTGFGDLEAPPVVTFFMPDTTIEAGDRLDTKMNLLGPGLDRTVLLYVCLETGGMHYFFPSYTPDPEGMEIPVTLGFDLAPITGDPMGCSILTIEDWPEGIPEMSFTWWGVLLDPADGSLVGDPVTLTWHCR